MCGVVGFIDVKKRLPSAVARKYIRAMSKTVVHRGPDDSGVWIDEKNGIYLGHQRLSTASGRICKNKPKNKVFLHIFPLAERIFCVQLDRHEKNLQPIQLGH